MSVARSGVWIALLVALGCGADSASQRAGFADAPGNPGIGAAGSDGILLVVVDTFRTDALAALPRLADLAATRGGWMGSTVTPANMTPAGFAGLIQGVDIEPNATEPAAEPTLAERLSDEGWDTRFVVTNGHVGWGPWLRGYGTVEESYLDDDRAIEQTKTWMEQASGPTFITTFLLGAHQPFESSETCAALGQAISEQPFNPGADPVQVRACYDAELELLDAQLAPVVAAALDLGWDVVVAADHGEALGQDADAFYGHAGPLDEAQNTGALLSWGVAEPSGSVALSTAVPAALMAGRGAEMVLPTELISRACGHGGGQPDIARLDPSSGRFTRLDDATLEALGVSRPTCPPTSFASWDYRDVPPSAREALVALGYLEHPAGH